MLRVTKLGRMKLGQITNHACEMLKFPGGPSSANTSLRTLRRMLSKAQELGQLQQVPKIMLRREWPRDLGNVVSLKTVMEVGGHSDAKTALRYQHPNVAELQQKLAATQTNGRVM